MRTTAAALGLLGGIALLVRALVEADLLSWVGLALLALAAGLGGALLVSRSALVLRVFVALAVPVLLGCLWWLLHDAQDDGVTVDAGTGALAVAVSVVALARRPAPRRNRRRGTARHSATLGT